MKKTGMILFILLLVLSLSTGCSNQENSITESNNTTDNNLEQISNKASQSDADMFTDRDYRTAYDENESILIHLNGDSATASSNSVKISGSTVQITEEATYIISGTLNNGIILVDAEDTAKLQIVLNGVSIFCQQIRYLSHLQKERRILLPMVAALLLLTKIILMPLFFQNRI